jgi:hypothetical protein
MCDHLTFTLGNAGYQARCSCFDKHC